ncbi:uncharacterized protein A4U43_C10F8390 [Asparagus officinalis]|uniref:Uncharacterized protein n=1 Tax=Asparagus officinalis TaxID=4686 RepID=A0A5P1E5Z3_ASPOF|nr:uncharacterized protein A4U43_C10F8390 [Asparagus officinalis]
MLVAAGDSSYKVIDNNRHVVTLTSTTLGSLRLDFADGTATTSSTSDVDNDEVMMKTTKDIKSLSQFIETRIPKTLTEHDTINTWELIEDLEEVEAEAQFKHWSSATIERSLSFDNATPSPKPQWLESTPDEPIVSNFNPEILSNLRKAVSELSPQHQTLLKSPEPTK